MLNGARPVFLRQRGLEWPTHSEWGYLVSSRTEGEGAGLLRRLGVVGTAQCMSIEKDANKQQLCI